MRAVELHDAPRVVGLAGDVGLGQLGVEPRRDQFVHGHVVGMGVEMVRDEKDPRPMAADGAGQELAVLDGRLQPAVGQAKVLADGVAQGRVGLRSLGNAPFGRAVGRRFSAGDVHQGHALAGGAEHGDGAAHGQFGVVGVGREDHVLGHRGSLAGRTLVTAPLYDSTMRGWSCKASPFRERRLWLKITSWSSDRSTWTWWCDARRCPRRARRYWGTVLCAAPGGKGGNQAVAAARLGGACRMVGRVGDDAFGQTLLAGLRAAGWTRIAWPRPPVGPAGWP